jgi:signal transduction histidine kinase/ActR/RegA family two-component response regulator
VKLALATNFSLLMDIETGARGYVITSDTNFLDFSDVAIPKIQKNILHLEHLIIDPNQKLKLDSLKQLIDKKIAISLEIIEVRKQFGYEAAVEIISSKKGKKIMDDIRKLADNMVGLEEKLLIARTEVSYDSYLFAQIFVILGSVISILITIFLMIINAKSQKMKEDLLESEEVLIAVLSSKQQFLANMSHEIRTPMNAILGFTKVMMKTDLEPKQKEYLDAIKTSSDGLIVVINDILDLSKVDAGKMTFEQTPFKLESSLLAMFQVFDLKIQEKNLELVQDYDPRIPEILKGDKVRLHQILLNLLSNALKFTEKGKITIAVRLLDQDNDSVNIEFAISDTGIGIKEEHMKDIFENFQQASNSTSRIFGGTGLGLAICKQLIEKQGGTISVKSTVGVGSTFSFTLRILKSDTKIELKNSEEELTAENREIKVLLVEDVKLNQLLMRIILDDFKFKYDIVDNGKFAIEKLETESYDVILMDLQMPEMDGFEATEYIRKKLHSKIPIIALTADVTFIDVERCKAVGMNDYISKPFDENILYKKIIDLIKSSIISST